MYVSSLTDIILVLLCTIHSRFLYVTYRLWTTYLLFKRLVTSYNNLAKGRAYNIIYIDFFWSFYLSNQDNDRRLQPWSKTCKIIR